MSDVFLFFMHLINPVPQSLLPHYLTDDLCDTKLGVASGGERYQVRDNKCCITEEYLVLT